MSKQKFSKIIILPLMIIIILFSGCTDSEDNLPSIDTVYFNLYAPASYNADGDNTTISLTVENHDTVAIKVVNSSMTADFNKVNQINITGITELQPDESQVINITFSGNRTKNIVRINIIVEKDGVLYITGEDY